MVDVTVRGPVGSDPATVYRYLADLSNWPRWQSDMQSSTLVSGTPGEVGATYRYVSRAMGQTFDSTVRIVRADGSREIAFEGDWAGIMRPNGRYLVEPGPGGSTVTLNPHPEARGVGKLLAPLMAIMIRRLNRKHLDDLRRELERGAS
jgi:Polyketide cyclase / dehydrase and lipid transport